MRRIRACTPRPKRWVRLSNVRLKAAKNRDSMSVPGVSGRGLSISAHKAGVSDKATTAENSVDTATVTANCLYMMPEMPPRNATGTNTAHKMSAIAMTGPETSAMAFVVAARASMPPCARWCSTASTTTMASSTTIPIASTMPNSVSVLMVKPNRVNAAKVATSETGTASIGITVARQFCRNRNTTTSTSNSASIKVCTTSFREALTNLVLSNTMSYAMSSGKATDNSWSCFLIRPAVSMALASGVRLMDMAAAGWPLSLL